MNGKQQRLAAWASVVALALASSITSITNKFAYDDVAIILRNDRVHSLSNLWTLWTTSYWPKDVMLGGLYRPVTVTSFALQWAAGDGHPMVFHAASVLLYALVCVAVFWLASQLLAPVFAWVAAALFAVHPLHAESVGNLVGQAELWAALFMVLAAVVFIRARRSGPLTAQTTIVLGVLYALACLSKENGVVLPLLLGAAELTLDRSGRPLRRRITELRPLFLLLLLVGLAFVWVRGMIMTGMADLVAPIFQSQSFRLRALTMFRVLLDWVRLFFWPANLSADYGPRRIEIVTGPTPEMMASVLILIGVGALAWTSRRAVPVLTFAIAWVLIGLIIPSNLLIPTGFVLAERTLFLASVGVPLGIAAAAERINSRVQISTRGKQFAVAGLALALVLGTARSALRQPVWRDNATLFAQTVVDAPTSYRARMMHSFALKAQKRDAEALDELRLARLIFPADPELMEYTAVEYGNMQRCPLAIPLYRRALELDPARILARQGLTVCLMIIGDYAGARSEVVKGLARGGARDSYLRLRFMTDSLETAARARSAPRK